ncbi:MAG: hypothetical protein M1385_02945 [Candidatus Marsarchaeota archaeon]|nr:hypothetical protein [Candidatus Marsarchaeota archaeon]
MAALKRYNTEEEKLIKIASSRASSKEELRMILRNKKSLTCDVIDSLAENPNTPSDVLDEIVISNLPSGTGKRDIASHPNVNVKTLVKLADNHSSFVRTAVALNKRTPVKVLQKLIKDNDWIVRNTIAKNSKNANLLESLAYDNNINVRLSVAKNRNISITTLLQLLNDNNDVVAKTVSSVIDGEDRKDRKYNKLFLMALHTARYKVASKIAKAGKLDKSIVKKYAKKEYAQVLRAGKISWAFSLVDNFRLPRLLPIKQASSHKKEIEIFLEEKWKHGPSNGGEEIINTLNLVTKLLKNSNNIMAKKLMEIIKNGGKTTDGSLIIGIKIKLDYESAVWLYKLVNKSIAMGESDLSDFRLKLYNLLS